MKYFTIISKLNNHKMKGTLLLGKDVLKQTAGIPSGMGQECKYYESERAKRGRREDEEVPFLFSLCCTLIFFGLARPRFVLQQLT